MLELAAKARRPPGVVEGMRDAVALLGAYEEARVMIESRVYKIGTNPSVDRAVAARPDINAFLRQDRGENARMDGSSARSLAGWKRIDWRRSPTGRPFHGAGHERAVAQPQVLLLQILHPPRLIRFQATTFLAPADSRSAR